MSYLSLYRRYRPQRFDEVLGQDHVTTALRNAVRTSKVSHAYLFSGPRGTGKTSSARILAKALNCTDLRDGEPCGECASCVAVVAGASMDVFELDAASNNGVDAMRDLVGRANLGTPGRRKVYIVDEVHMLSTAASNALLKTLEEPPDHVVFVLATTDPQKVLPTIRSRTQPFEFRLLSTALLASHLTQVAEDAGLEVSAADIEVVARRGNGSARDALSALDQAAAAGGVDASAQPVDELVSAIGTRDTGSALVAIDRAAQNGRDPRQLARDLIESLRRAFLAHLAPSLVEAGPDPQGAPTVTAAQATRAIEALGECLVAMRDSIDPRIDLEVAIVRLTRPELDTSLAAIVERLERLERQERPPASNLASPTLHQNRPAEATSDGGAATTESSGSASAGLPGTGSRLAGTRAAGSPPEVPRPAGPISGGESAGGVAAAARAALEGAPMKRPAAPTASASPPPLSPRPPALAAPAVSGAAVSGAAVSGAAELSAPIGVVASGPVASESVVSGPTLSAPPALVASGTAASRPASPVLTVPAIGSLASPPTDGSSTVTTEMTDLRALWAEVIPSLPRQKALFAPGRVISTTDASITIGFPNDMHRARCADRMADVQVAVEARAGRPISLEFVVDPGAVPEPAELFAPPPEDEPGERRASPLRVSASAEARATLQSAGPMRKGGTVSSGPRDPREGFEDVDTNDLRDATDAGIGSTLEQFTRAFPGATLVNDDRG